MSLFDEFMIDAYERRVFARLLLLLLLGQSGGGRRVLQFQIAIVNVVEKIVADAILFYVNFVQQLQQNFATTRLIGCRGELFE